MHYSVDSAAIRQAAASLLLHAEHFLVILHREVLGLLLLATKGSESQQFLAVESGVVDIGQLSPVFLLEHLPIYKLQHSALLDLFGSEHRYFAGGLLCEKALDDLVGQLDEGVGVDHPDSPHLHRIGVRYGVDDFLDGDDR